MSQESGLPEERDTGLECSCGQGAIVIRHKLLAAAPQGNDGESSGISENWQRTAHCNGCGALYDLETTERRMKKAAVAIKGGFFATGKEVLDLGSIEFPKGPTPEEEKACE